MEENNYSCDVNSKPHQLLESAFNGDLCNLKKLGAEWRNEKTAIVDVKAPNGLSPLHLVAREGYLDICKYLIDDLKLNVDAKTKKGETPLHFACLAGQLDTSECLVEKGAGLDIASNDGCVPLHCAAELGHQKLLHLLLSKGAEVDVHSEAGTPLQKATSRAKHEAVRILLDHHADPNLSLGVLLSPLLASIDANSLQCVELLLEAGADPNSGSLGVTPLEVAATRGHMDIARCLLKAGADPNKTNAEDQTPIEIAALKGYHKLVEVLFPVTSPIPWYLEWSCEGIVTHVNSEEASIQRKIKEKEVLKEDESKAIHAFQRKDYPLAIFFFSKVLWAEPKNITLLANRSLCFARLRKGDLALGDAITCMALKPNWPKAYYRTGVAWSILEEFEQAADAFFKGLKLDPENNDLQKAYQKALEDSSKSNRDEDQCYCFD